MMYFFKNIGAIFCRIKEFNSELVYMPDNLFYFKEIINYKLLPLNLFWKFNKPYNIFSLNYENENTVLCNLTKQLAK